MFGDGMFGDGMFGDGMFGDGMFGDGICGSGFSFGFRLGIGIAGGIGGILRRFSTVTHPFW
ncbi:hypothetical protein KDN35_11795 [Brevibacillus sp. NL20B1]|nr:hypothetical protein [Brevibacillus sp. NL20B1]